MRNDKGAIAIFTLLAMLFFLIFVMVGFNNISSKSKVQVETTGVLLDSYKSYSNSEAILDEIMAGNLSEDVIKTSDESSVSNKSGKYIAISGKIYKIP